MTSSILFFNSSPLSLIFSVSSSSVSCSSSFFLGCLLRSICSCFIVMYNYFLNHIISSSCINYPFYNSILYKLGAKIYCFFHFLLIYACEFFGNQFIHCSFWSFAWSFDGWHRANAKTVKPPCLKRAYYILYSFMSSAPGVITYTNRTHWQVCIIMNYNQTVIRNP